MNGTLAFLPPSPGPPPHAPRGQCALLAWCMLSSTQMLATPVPQSARFAIAFEILVQSSPGLPGQYRGVMTMGAASDGIAVFVRPPTGGGTTVQLVVVAHQLRTRTGTILPAARNISVGQPTHVRLQTGPEGSSLTIARLPAGEVSTAMEFNARDGIGLCGTSVCADALVRNVVYDPLQPPPPGIRPTVPPPSAPSTLPPPRGMPPVPPPSRATKGASDNSVALLIGLTLCGALCLVFVTGLILWRARHATGRRPTRPGSLAVDAAVGRRAVRLPPSRTARQPASAQ